MRQFELARAEWEDCIQRFGINHAITKRAYRAYERALTHHNKQAEAEERRRP